MMGLQREPLGNKIRPMLAHLQDYVRAAAEAADVPEAVILGAQRRRSIAYHRQAAMALAYRAGYSMPEIGSAFNKDHTTVKYACVRFEAGRLERETARVVEALTGQGALL